MKMLELRPRAAAQLRARGVPLVGIGLPHYIHGREPFQYLTERRCG